jgi:hypothetical protein
VAQPVQMPHHLPRAVIRAIQERLVDQRINESVGSLSPTGWK